MKRGLIIPTEKEGVVLKELKNPADDRAYFEAIERSRAHLSQFGDITSQKYPDIDSVRNARLHPTNPNRKRLGIWNTQDFVGSINLTPKRGLTEVGYWLSQEHTGNGYATFALRALNNFAYERGYPNVFADVAEANIASIAALERAGFIKVSRDVGKLVFRALKNKHRPDQIMVGEEQYAIDYITSNPVSEGVLCDSYEINDDPSRDLAIITVDKGCKTPLQQVAGGTETTEAYLAGMGTLTTFAPAKSRQSVYAYGNGEGYRTVNMSLGEQMQWRASDKSNLIFCEICKPPYQPGRFINLSI